MLAAGGLAGFWERLEGGYRTPIKYLPPFQRLRAEAAARKSIAVLTLVTLSIGWAPCYGRAFDLSRAAAMRSASCAILIGRLFTTIPSGLTASLTALAMAAGAPR